jgi:anti-anti-sigma factor
MEFGVVVGYSDEAPVLAVAGELDLLTAPTFRAVLNSVIDEVVPSVVLDVAELTFIGADGLGMIADASRRLRRAGATLAIRSPSAQLRRLLDITGLTTQVRVETAPTVRRPVEQAADDQSFDTEHQRADLAWDVLRSRSTTTTVDAVMDAALRLVTTMAQATIHGADGVSVTLERHGRMTTVASSDDTVLRMDELQYETGEGPCLAAAAVGRPFHVPALADDQRWPNFAPRAVDEGIASILSTPLIADRRPLGALNVYSRSRQAFGAPQQELAALFATQASDALADARADVSEGQLAARIADALVAREVIAHAQGILMERERIPASTAAVRLHRNAKEAGVPVRAYAAELRNSVAQPSIPGGSPDDAPTA